MFLPGQCNGPKEARRGKSLLLLELAGAKLSSLLVMEAEQ